MSHATARHPLHQGWQLGAVAPGHALPVHWRDAAGPGALASQLQAWGEWQPQAPAWEIDNAHWVWRLRFDRPEGLSPRALLALDGLATVCEVQLNGAPLLASDNMFIAHRVPVAQRLQAQGNELLIHALPLAPRLAERRARPRWRVPMLQQQQLRWWRTTLLGRTPGWSLPAPPLGPWRSVWLTEPEALLAERLQLRPTVAGQQGRLQIRLSDAPNVALQVMLSRSGQSHRVTLQPQPDGSATATLVIEQVALWWPHTHGEPALYEASLVVGEDGETLYLPLHRIGFRTLQWRHEQGDLALQVNSVPVFARGACWTPIDPLRLHADDAAYAPAIAQVCAAGMNMLRVSGSMVYEADAFYDACDAQGMLVWQDFMFANMDYPGEDPAFLASVQQEVQQQLMRWQGRPSLALLCGNSEVEQQAAMWGAPRALWQPALFHDTLPAWCAQHLPDAAYWPSSAHGGALPMAPDTGSCSYYGVGAYQRDDADASSSRLRFASECLAFAQVPEDAALDRMPGGRALRTHHPAWKQAAPRDLGAGWDFEDVRDHYLRREFQLDPNELRRHDHERYLMLSRVAVTRVSQAAFSRWRAAGSACRGALVWFLRDLQAGAGWGLLDELGHPKATWHALSQVLQPVALLITDEGLNGLHLHLINERAQAIEATLTLAAWRGGQCLAQASAPHTLAARSTRAVPAQDLLEHFSDLNWVYRFGPPPYDFLQATLRASDGRVLGRASHLCAGWRAEQWQDPGLQAHGQRIDAQTVRVELRCLRPALAVHLTLPGHQPDAGYFDLAPGDVRSVLLHGTSGTRAPRGQAMAANTRLPVPIEGLT